MRHVYVKTVQHRITRYWHDFLNYEIRERRPKKTKHNIHHHIKMTKITRDVWKFVGAFSSCKERIRENGTWNREIFEELLIVALAYSAQER